MSAPELELDGEYGKMKDFPTINTGKDLRNSRWGTRKLSLILFGRRALTCPGGLLGFQFWEMWLQIRLKQRNMDSAFLVIVFNNFLDDYILPHIPPRYPPEGIPPGLVRTIHSV